MDKEMAFFHLIFVPLFFIGIIMNLYIIIFAEYNTVKELFDVLLFCNFLGYLLFLCVLLRPCIIIYAIVLIYILIRKKPIYISNNFLLHNKIYNIIYIFSWLQLFLLIIFYFIDLLI